MERQQVTKSNWENHHQKETPPFAKPVFAHTSVHSLVQFQQTFGNRAVGRFIRAKLKISQPGDVYEQEADRVAEAVMRRPGPQAPAGGADSGGGQPSTVPPIVHEVRRSPGQSLDPATGGIMESRFDYDFSQVRVHTDARVAVSARTVNALVLKMLWGTKVSLSAGAIGRQFVESIVRVLCQEFSVIGLGYGYP